MSKTLQDYKQETVPKTEVQLIQEFKTKKYRAIDALYIGLAFIVLFFILQLTDTNLFGIKINSLDDYIEFRKNLIWVTLVERVFWVFGITYFANRINRIPLPWQIFAFFTPYLALIVIGLTPKIDNNFYEYKSSIDKEDFFKSMSLTEKLNLYQHLLTRTNFTPYWYDKIPLLSSILFADETTALETLKEYERLYNKNLLTELKAKMPDSQNDRQNFFKAVEDLGLVDESFYRKEENSSS